MQTITVLPAVEVSTVNCALLLMNALFRPRPLLETFEPSELNLGIALASPSEISFVSIVQWDDSDLLDAFPLPEIQTGS